MTVQIDVALPSANLQPTIINLSHLQLIEISGPDAAKFLQGQLTVNTLTLPENQYTFAAHCDAQGKVCSIFLLYRQADKFYCLLPADLIEQQLAELKKYAIFSKVDLHKLTQVSIIGLAGQESQRLLSTIIPQIANKEQTVIHSDPFTLLYLPYPQPRWIIIAEQQQMPDWPLTVSNQITQWQALDIEAGYPLLSSLTSNQFLPQALNLQALNGVDFQKGCYIGQESIARAKYRGINKRVLNYLIGQSEQAPGIGKGLEMQLNENWRLTGIVLAAVKMQSGEYWLQAVLNKDIAPQTLFRTPNDDQSAFILSALPYTLHEEE